MVSSVQAIGTERRTVRALVQRNISPPAKISDKGISRIGWKFQALRERCQRPARMTGVPAGKPQRRMSDVGAFSARSPLIASVWLKTGSNCEATENGLGGLSRKNVFETLRNDNAARAAGLSLCHSQQIEIRTGSRGGALTIARGGKACTQTDMEKPSGKPRLPRQVLEPNAPRTFHSQWQPCRPCRRRAGGFEKSERVTQPQGFHNQEK